MTLTLLSTELAASGHTAAPVTTSKIPVPSKPVAAKTAAPKTLFDKAHQKLETKYAMC